MVRRRVDSRTVLACSLWITFGAVIQSRLSGGAATRTKFQRERLCDYCGTLPRNLIGVHRSPVLGDLYARSIIPMCRPMAHMRSPGTSAFTLLFGCKRTSISPADLSGHGPKRLLAYVGAPSLLAGPAMERGNVGDGKSPCPAASRRKTGGGPARASLLCR